MTSGIHSGPMHPVRRLLDDAVAGWTLSPIEFDNAAKAVSGRFKRRSAHSLLLNAVDDIRVARAEGRDSRRIAAWVTEQLLGTTDRELESNDYERKEA